MSGKTKLLAKLTFAFLLTALIIIILITHHANQLALILISYAAGSIPFGYLLSKFALAQDIRKVGSGNIGATNVLRTGNKGLAALTLLLDASKGALAILFLSNYTHTDLIFYSMGIAAMLGHLFPIWLDFKGGKGVATGLGLLLVLSWQLALCAVALWLLIAAVTKYSSLAALVTAGLLPLFALVFGDAELSLFTLILGGLIYMRHIDNIKRLLSGKESKIGNKTSS